MLLNIMRREKSAILYDLFVMSLLSLHYFILLVLSSCTIAICTFSPCFALLLLFLPLLLLWFFPLCIVKLSLFVQEILCSYFANSLDSFFKRFPTSASYKNATSWQENDNWVTRSFSVLHDIRSRRYDVEYLIDNKQSYKVALVHTSALKE